eukprot:468149-Prymnesium_polylepis.2
MRGRPAPCGHARTHGQGALGPRVPLGTTRGLPRGGYRCRRVRDAPSPLRAERASAVRRRLVAP